MLHILLITARRERIESFVEGLCSDRKVRLDIVLSGAEALGILQTVTPHLVIVDSTSENIESFDLVRSIIGVNAMVNTAVASPLSDEQFHDRGEGLGILCRVPLDPGRGDSNALLQRLRDLTATA
ncbi:MAG: response regulator [Syntrophobacteraceae bacterium]|nr:response regulator [Syntrophobacteraceae bacterium]